MLSVEIYLLAIWLLIPHGSVVAVSTLHVGVILDEHYDNAYWNVSSRVDALLPAVSQAIFVSLPSLSLSEMPRLELTVIQFSINAVCNLLSNGVQAIISLTECRETAWITSITSPLFVPHFPVRSTNCEPVESVNLSLYTRSLALDPDLRRKALHDLLSNERVVRGQMMTKGPVELIYKLLREAKQELLSRSNNMLFSTHLYQLKDFITDTYVLKPGAAVQISALLNYWAYQQSGDFSEVRTDHYIVELEHRECLRELFLIHQADLLQEQVYWILADVIDHPPSDLLVIMNRTVQVPRFDILKGDANNNRPNVGFFRQFPVLELEDCSHNYQADHMGLFVMKVFNCDTLDIPEPLVLITYLIYVIGRSFTGANNLSDIPATLKPVSCNGPLDEPSSIMRSKMFTLANNDITESLIPGTVWFYASCRPSTGGPLAFHATMRTTMSGSELTKEGHYINEKTQFSGVFPNRFYGLRNATLRVGTVVDRPMLFSADVGENLRLYNATGMAIDLLDLLAERFDFQYELYLPADGQYGALRENGTYSGLIGELIDGKLDMIIGLFTITDERSLHVSFLGAFFSTYLSTLISKPPSESKLFQMYETFDVLVWVASMSAVIIAGILVAGYNWMSPLSAWNRQLTHADSDEISPTENMWFIFRCMMLQSNDTFPLAWSTRITILLFWFFVVIWHASWQADMTAIFSKRELLIPVQSVSDISLQNKIRPFVTQGSSVYTFFKESKTNVVYSRIYEMLSADKINIVTTDEGVELLRKNPNLAFISDRYLLQSAFTAGCEEFVLLDEVFDESPGSFAVPLGTEHTAAFTEYLMSLAETGVIDYLLTKWLPKLEICVTKQPEYRSLDLEHVGGGFVPLVICSGLSFIALLFEAFWFRMRRHRKKNTGENDADGLVIPSRKQSNNVLKRPSFLTVPVTAHRRHSLASLKDGTTNEAFEPDSRIDQNRRHSDSM